jgi:class 3 adenylate cyclase/tetratricopeptide (TPR) repeat protein
MQPIRQWLEGLGLAQYAAVFEGNDVDLDILSALAEEDLHRLGVSLGHRKRILRALEETKAAAVSSERSPAGPVAAKLSSAIESLTAQGERRQVTVLFCDLVGSTALSNTHDPEEYRAILARYHETCIAAIQRFEGFVAQIQGDGILAYFGYPLAHEAEAERAVRAGLSIVEALASLDLGSAGPLRVRIGIASGLVVVSHILAPDKSAVGETPNLAARLQTVAQPGEVMVGERTRTLAGGGFEYEDRGVHALKGIAEPTRAFRVLGPSDAVSRFEAATRGGLTPMVGREQEIGLLLDRWELSRAAEGQVVLLQGEPGIGKSRLLRAFRERLNTRIEMALQYQCSPYYVNSAFYPIADHLQRALKFQRDDSAEQKLDKLERYLLSPPPLAGEATFISPSPQTFDSPPPLAGEGEGGGEHGGGEHAGGKQDRGKRTRTDCSLLARALSIPCDDRYGPLEMSPQRQKDDTIRLLVDIVANIARSQATAMLFEDVHWADPTTIEVLGALIDRTETLPLLVLITYRPEFQPPWISRSPVTPLALTRLSRAQGASIVLGVASGKPLPADLVTQIVDKTDGVPLFLEELTKAVLESNLIIDLGDRYDYSGSVNKLTIPNTLRDSLMARLDRLIPVKEIAQIGACLGREFSYELVAAVSPMSEAQLNEALEKLTASELVFRRGSPPEAVYIFKHALVQDAAYDSLLKSKRQGLHAQIAAAIRERFPAKAETEPELLAHHYTEAGMIPTAIPYWQRAGELAQERVALQEAIRHYERGLELTSTLAPSSARDTWELQLRALLGMAWVELHGYTHPQVEASLEPALRLDQSLDHGDYTLRILWGMWVFRLCTSEFEESLVWAKRLLTRAQETDSENMRIVGHWCACNSNFFLGELLKCVDHANALLGRYDAVRHAHLADLVNHDPKTVALMYRAGAEWALGFPEQAAATAEAAILHADQRRHPFDRCWVRHFGTLFVYGPRGDLDRAAVLIAELESHATEQRLLFMNHVWVPAKRALCLVWADRYAEAFVACGNALKQWIAAGLRIALPQLQAAFAESAVGCNRPDEAISLLDEGLAHIERPGCNERYALAEVLRVKAWALQVKGRLEESEALFQQALDTARAQNAKSWELRTATSFARMLKDQGRATEAFNVLEPVYRWFTEGHDTRDLKQAAQLLAELK